MVTKREYLIEKGLAKAGRGRFGAEAKKAIADAINSGMKFDDPTGKTVIVVSKDENGNEVQTTRRIVDVPEVADPRPDRPNGMYTFENPDGSTFKRLHTNACANCHYSFQWCYCVNGPTQFPYPYKTEWGINGIYAVLAGTPSRMVITTEDVPEKQPQQGLPRRGRGRGKGKAQVTAA